MLACSPDPGSTEDADWVGTITTEGDVTTVVNESGSVWAGAATLVEEASIGVESGPDEYMLGRVSSVYATDDRIFVLDGQVPVLRVYDHGGAFVRNIGQVGQGPGEYTDPAIVAADDAGRAYVLDSRLARINVYSAEGEPLDSFPIPDSRCCVWPMYSLTGEAVWAPVQEWRNDRTERYYGVQAIGPDGPYGDITFLPEYDFEQTTFEVRPGFDSVTPFSPWVTWNPAPEGGLLIGTSDRYWFELLRRDGSRLVVERYWEPVLAPAEHKDWERRRTIAFRRRYEGPEFNWDGAEIPDHKPAYYSLIPSLSGEIWVYRPGPSVRLADCAEDPLEEGNAAAYERPCWTNQSVVDVFGPDGRYLGVVEVPDELSRIDALTFFVDGAMVVGVVQDEAGTVMVKRYRLVVPEREQTH